VSFVLHKSDGNSTSPSSKLAETTRTQQRRLFYLCASCRHKDSTNDAHSILVLLVARRTQQTTPILSLCFLSPEGLKNRRLFFPCASCHQKDSTNDAYSISVLLVTRRTQETTPILSLSFLSPEGLNKRRLFYPRVSCLQFFIQLRDYNQAYQTSLSVREATVLSFSF
jgi:hypothetical protein